MIYNLDIVETESRTIQFYNFDTVLIKYKDYVNVSLEQAREDFIVYDILTKQHSVKKLIISGKNTFIDKEARAFILVENFLRSELIRAEAIVIRSRAQQILGNIYITFSETFYPTKLFCNEDEAKTWLKQA